MQPHLRIPPSLRVGWSMVLRQAAERSRELTLRIEMKDRALAELAAANQRFTAQSRQAGMAEVATNVLHNVSNVLNSLNVSATIVTGKLHESRVNKLTALADMLIDHSREWDGILRDDPKGQRVLLYLSTLGRHFEQERESMLMEPEQVTKHVGHIKVEDAIRVLGTGLNRDGIDLTRIFAHGFATRRQGHGFGLHSAAVSAQQLGGGLWAESEGPGCGAVFTLELPLQPLKVKEEGSSDASAIRH